MPRGYVCTVLSLNYRPYHWTSLKFGENIKKEKKKLLLQHPSSSHGNLCTLHVLHF